MNIATLDYVGDYTVLCFICKILAIIAIFIILNVLLQTKKDFKKTKCYKVIMIVGCLIIIASIASWLNSERVRKNNIQKFAQEIEANISTDYSITSDEAYKDIAKLYDSIAIGKDYSSKDFVLYNKVSRQEVKVELIYEAGLLKIRGIL